MEEYETALQVPQCFNSSFDLGALETISRDVVLLVEFASFFPEAMFSSGLSGTWFFKAQRLSYCRFEGFVLVSSARSTLVWRWDLFAHAEGEIP